MKVTKSQRPRSFHHLTSSDEQLVAILKGMSGKSDIIYIDLYDFQLLSILLLYFFFAQTIREFALLKIY